ncbi:MAG: S41 family peptidase [Chlorobiaceae bacterium]
MRRILQGHNVQRRAVRLVTLLFFCFMPVAPLYPAVPADRGYLDILKNIDLLGEVYGNLSRSYVDSLDVSSLMSAGIDGMLHTLDPYTVFLDKADSEELDELTSGQYAGIGVTIASVAGKVYIASVVDGYAAAAAGLRVGDRLASINRTGLHDKSLDDVKALLKGPSGEELTLTVEREGSKPLTVKLSRAEVRVNTVSYSGITGDIGYLEMKSFGARSPEELREALQALFRQARERKVVLKGVILDLRNNPGGLLTAAVEVTSLFVPKGSLVVSIRGRQPEASKSWLTETQPLDASMPLAVLINPQSASASEIVSGAIQDLDRGVVLGERSYGKGLVQSVLPLSYDNTLKLTTAKYYTPSGRLIQKESLPVKDARKVLLKGPAESSAKVFHTKGRRKVYGGGGITPDITLAEQPSSPYLNALRKSGMLFLYAARYRSEHPVLPQFPLEEKALMASFNAFLKERSYVYLSEPERRLNALKESLKGVAGGQDERRVKLLGDLQEEAGRLRDLETLRDSEQVKSALEVEILRHYSEKLARKEEVDQDPLVKKAVAILSDQKRFSRILHP